MKFLQSGMAYQLVTSNLHQAEAFMLIGLISDTHGFLDDRVYHHFHAVDEIWHAGDFGDDFPVEELLAFKPLRAVWGNIDGSSLRQRFPEQLVFQVAGLTVAMIHIGGYPGKYAPRVLPWLKACQPGLFISGHSHIVKAMPDAGNGWLHVNPGAAGRHGWHTVRTLMRFRIELGAVRQLELIELGKR